MSISVVMPVYNEEGVIEHVVRSVHKNITSKIKDSELIIVNDCSTDNTSNILRKLNREIKQMRIITPQKNGGHGKAIRLGFRNAKKEWVFHIDSDNQFDPADFWKLEKYKGSYDMVLGARLKRQDPIYRKILSFFVRVINFTLFGTLIKETNSAFKLVNNKVLRQTLDIVPEDTMAPTIMITLLSNKLKYRIKVVDISHFPRKTGASIHGWKLIKTCYRGVKDMLKFRIKTIMLPSKLYEDSKKIRIEITQACSTTLIK